MRKMFLRIAALTLCAALLSGCNMPDYFSISSFTYDDAEKYTMGGAVLSDAIDTVEIDWISGSVLVDTHSDHTVAFEEHANRKLSKDTTLYYWLEGKTLHIKFGRSGKWRHSGLDKDLTLYLPEQLLEELEVESVSAKIEVNGIGASHMKLDTVSGEIAASLPGMINDLEIGTVSGTAHISAPQIGSFEADSTSGEISLSVETAPEKLDVDTVSGNFDLYLPETAGFELRFDTVSGNLDSEIPCETDGKNYIYGDGTATYRVETVSGNLRIEPN